MLRILRLSPLALLVFGFSSAAQARVCTPAGEVCTSSLSCCEGECKQGRCLDNVAIQVGEVKPKDKLVSSVDSGKFDAETCTEASQR